MTGGCLYGASGFNDIPAVRQQLAPEHLDFGHGLQPTVQLRATPIDSGQTRLQVRAAQADVRGAAAGVDLTRVNLAFDVTNDFYQLLRAQSLANLSVEQVRQANEQLQLVLGKIAAGAEAAVNRYQFDVALANAQVTLLHPWDNHLPDKRPNRRHHGSWAATADSPWSRWLPVLVPNTRVGAVGFTVRRSPFPPVSLHTLNFR